MYYMTIYIPPIAGLGKFSIVSDGDSIIGIWMDGQKNFASTLRETPEIRDDLPIFLITRNWFDRYFSGENPSISEIPMAPYGSDFRQLIWKLLCEIPYGMTTTYGELAGKAAKILGRKSMSAQAVGGAVGHNPISVIIPCHRVIGSGGNLTGYAGGIEKKKLLLDHEKNLRMLFAVEEKWDEKYMRRF